MSSHGAEYLEIDDVSRTLAVFGFYVSVIGLASYTLKERLYMSDALLALAVGIVCGPLAWNVVNPSDWTDYNEELTNRITYEITRIVIGIQVLFTGIALPKAYLKHAWESLTTLLLLVMTCAWLSSAAFIFALVPRLTFLEALCIAACVTPTDPVLANSVVKGRFAEKHIPPHVRNLIAAESGANDGLGFPFIYLAIYIISRFVDNRSVGLEIGWWILDIWLYQIALSCAIGAVIGFLARKAVKFAEEKNMIDHESFLAIGVGLTFFTLGVTGMLGSDDILASFIVGNSFTWDDYFRVRTEDESFQDVLDSLLNTGIFIYIGAILPWSDFGNHDIGLSAWRLVVIGILIMLFRRLPWVLATKKLIPDLVTWKEALFTGWFGPIGVGAVYYAQVGLRRIPEDRVALRQLIVPVVYFVVLCSVIVHGVTIPIVKHTPRVYHRTKSLTLTRSSQGRDDMSTKFKNALSNGHANGQSNGKVETSEGGTAQQRGGAPEQSNSSSNDEHDNDDFRADGDAMERGDAGRSTEGPNTTATRKKRSDQLASADHSRSSTPTYPRPGTMTPNQRSGYSTPRKEKSRFGSGGEGDEDVNGSPRPEMEERSRKETGATQASSNDTENADQHDDGGGGGGQAGGSRIRFAPTPAALNRALNRHSNNGDGEHHHHHHILHQETPVADTRNGGPSSWDEGNFIVTEGADGRIQAIPKSEAST